MANFVYNGTVPNLSLDDVLVGAAVQGNSGTNIFTLINPANGYTINFIGQDFTYSAPVPGGVPTGGMISQINLVNANGVTVLEVTGITGSMATFWATFAAGGQSHVGSAAAFTALLAIDKDDVINGGNSDDQIGVYGAGGIVLGYAGNDTFIVNEGVSGAKIHGTVTVSTNELAQTDVVEIRGNASLAELHDIDLIRFGNTPATAKTLTFNGNGFFGVKAIQGSAAGADTIKFVGGAEAVDLDISHLQFSNWGRANQQILVEMNTGTDKPLDDRFVGSLANEHVTAGVGRDLLYGNAGDDYLDGGDGIDVLDGGAGNDTLIGGGGEGPNILMGGNGNDVYKFNEKLDVVIDTGGIDSWMVSKTTTLSAKSIFEGLAADDAVGMGKAINLTGNAKANLLIGHEGRNTLNGLVGNDILEGHGGGDKLDGGAGHDKLYGGLGNDSLTGGAGRDTFYFDTALGGANVVRIVAFSTRDDSIALESDIFTALAGSSKLSSAAFYSGSKAKDSGDRIIYNKSTGALSYDADGTGTAFSAIKFATLDKNLKLTASDFLIV